MSGMTLNILVDNSTLTGRFFGAEPAVSFHIQADGQNILMDTGYSDLFMRNAEKLKINLYDLDHIVFTGGYPEHCWGMSHLLKFYTEGLIEDINYKRPVLHAHTKFFESKKRDGFPDYGNIFTIDKIQKHFVPELSDKPVRISDHIFFLGEIQRIYNFEPPAVIEDNMGNLADHYSRDDSALVYAGSKGLVIMTGSAYSGICNIIETAKSVTGEDRIYDIVGGFNLSKPGEDKLIQTMRRIKEIRPIETHPGHNTDLRAKIALSTVVKVKESGSGMRLEYP